MRTTLQRDIGKLFMDNSWILTMKKLLFRPGHRSAVCIACRKGQHAGSEKHKIKSLHYLASMPRLLLWRTC
jgi:hypothetical protein